MIVSILITLISAVLMLNTVESNERIKYAVFTILGAVSTWGNYILNALEK